MIRAAPQAGASPAALLRLARLAPLAPADLSTLREAADAPRSARARTELLKEGQEITETRILLTGWAARARLLPDGRRQFLSFILPGDLIGLCHQSRPLAVSSIAALTDVTSCTAPSAEGLPRLAEAYAVSRAFEEAHLLSHVTRLGRLNAQERICDLLLELYERLDLVGLTYGSGFDMPLTQEVLADALGLTPVHVNRMLQLLRGSGDVRLSGRRLVLPDPVALARKLGRTPVRVTAARS